jgi:UDP-N-acetylmuramoylalanine--D-glutamate ligase
MHLRDLNGKRVCILGFGREGRATLRALERHAPGAEATVADRNPEVRAPERPLQTGPDYLRDLDRFDVVVKSPGIPPAPEIEAVRERLTTPTQLFFDSLAGTGARVIGVTGSKGKSTTSSLIHAVIQAGGRESYLVGNIGEPALDYLERAGKEVLFVHELSSYQLLDLTVSPPVAVVTAFFPDHLDYHGSLGAYLEAKKHLCRFQREEDVTFYNGRSPECAAIAGESAGLLVPFRPSDAPLPLAETHLIGEHNLGNIAAAYKVGRHLGVPDEACLSAFRQFRGLPHRLQSLGVHHGVEWVDDAISTTPESTIAALDALGDRVATLLLGGQDRGYDFTGLGRRVAASRVEHVILFPDTGPRIADAILSAGAFVTLHHAADMPSAVRLARAHTRPGTVCLLSTASPSYNLWANFEAKGREFQACILSG